MSAIFVSVQMEDLGGKGWISFEGIFDFCTPNICYLFAINIFADFSCDDTASFCVEGVPYYHSGAQ
jgi:hypothetical protein